MIKNIADLKAEEFIQISYADLDAWAASLYDTVYSTIDSIEEVHNDTYLLYTNWNFEDAKQEILSGEMDEELARWKKYGEGRKEGYLDEFLRQRDSLRFPDWTVIITLMIIDGHLPKKNYILEISW